MEGSNYQIDERRKSIVLGLECQSLGAEQLFGDFEEQI
jgi:hypothetical protein